MKRIIDANLNRATEAARVLEEIARFLLDDMELSKKMKKIRHKINSMQDKDYDACLESRDTEGDVGVVVQNSTERINIENIFKANVKRLQQALRTLAEYSVENAEFKGIFEKLRYTSYTLEKTMWENLKEKFSSIKMSEKKLYLVTNSDSFETEDDFLNAVASALEGGIDILQLREKNMSANKIVELGRKVKELCAQYNTIFIVNDRIDIAKILDADGVHLGQDDLPIAEARRILGQNIIVGKSTHAPEQALVAVEEGADYIGVGPLYETPTKQGREAVGLEYAKWVHQNIEVPAFGIGGVDLNNIDEVLNTGIERVAVVRAIINSNNPCEAARKFNQKIKDKEKSLMEV